MAYGTVNADVIQSSVSGVSLGAGNATVFKNRIINGAMMIDQRYAGTSFTPAGSGPTYTVDRWAYYNSVGSKLTYQQNGGSVTPPTGFINYMGITVASAYSVGSSDVFNFYQIIEGLNCADLAWGTANAKTVTLSFWVRSSLTGTFGGCLQNSALNRSYPFSYTISSANTWTQISVTVAGDTTGTWLTTNAGGIGVVFCLGAGSTYTSAAGSWTTGNYPNATGATSVVGTNGATFYITGVQLEVGSSATGFEYRDYGREFALCQRYYFTSYNYGIIAGTASQEASAIYVVGIPNQVMGGVTFPASMRTAPTVTCYHPSTGASGQIGNYADGVTSYAVSGTRQSDKQCTNIISSGSIGSATGCRICLTASAEL